MAGVDENFRCLRRLGAGMGLAGAAALMGLTTAAGAHADDQITPLLGVGSVADTGSAASAADSLATAAGNQDDPGVFAYSADPNNVFSPVYTIEPSGAEDVSGTDASGDVFGTQDFSISELGFPVDSFTGNVEYTPTPFDEATGLSGILSQLSQELGLGGGYSEEITTLGGTGTVLPDEPTSFLIDEFGFGYGNVFEESMNSAGTSATVGDFVLTPFGDENITPIVDLFLPSGITDAAGTVDPSSLTELLSAIGL